MLFSEPENLAAPSLRTLSGTSIEIKWNKPAHENGVMVGYNLYRRTTLQCPEKYDRFFFYFFLLVY